jgi:hypothetical protein
MSKVLIHPKIISKTYKHKYHKKINPNYPNKLIGMLDNKIKIKTTDKVNRKKKLKREHKIIY